jgi:hypothetical protein
MSTNSECEFIEPVKDKWYYILEDYHAPKNAWDWHEHATAYGPFPTEDAAKQHLGDNHANPGGWSVQSFDPAYKPSATLQKLLDKAVKPTRSTFGSMRMGWRR